MSDAINGVNVSDYMTLFMQELTYQDPMKPVDNKEFMSQMAQFSALQLTQETNDLMDRLIGMTVGSQALGLIGKYVKIKDSDEYAEVKTVRFISNEEPKLGIDSKGKPMEIVLGDISEVQ